MQSVTAIAHLRSAILYFMDLSEACGYSVDAQIQLYKNIKPLFANKLTFIVVNKTDLLAPDVLQEIIDTKLQEIIKTGEVELLQISCAHEINVMAARNAACDRLIAIRQSEKLKAGTNSSGEPTGRLGELLRRIHVAQPLGGIVREADIPDAAKNKMKYDKEDPNRRKLERDLEEEGGGAGVYSIDLKKNYLLEDDEWKNDRIPEVFNGMNVYDFIDPDIEAKLAALEEEEEKLEGEGYYDESEEITDDEEQEIRYKAELIREKRQLIRNEARMRKNSMKNKAQIPRSAKAKKLSDLEKGLREAGHETTSISSRARSQTRRPFSERGRSVAHTDDGDAMDVDATPKERLKRALSRPRSISMAGNRRVDGVTDEAARTKAERLAKLGQQRMNRMARQGEADRHTTASIPKHLFAGKRGVGSTRSR
jgi:nucleolar GTP-binding protein